ncbi:DNA polymerase IV [Campylobacter blaseri]|uniref:DNA polymerase IV n=1 Tax=Campylobacter blaseri TaxID=2042961 RepID=A0A2P8QYF9_9BACT|nr:DNA polymerase IV [Campylobacter blaseri]PSM51287.1 DNA polymerase IV [Campylobacter blaseri]PSM52431.1 DNA polymerase IV [Campylobacter blaseri]QKF86240.1 DNA polymerase IV [Campylobacter blaseri]
MILHLDLDCFFVAALRLQNPNLKGKPVAVVGGNSATIFGEEDRVGTVILSASYEARKYGVRSAMILKKAKALCPNLLIAKSDMKFYKELSKKLHNLLYSYTPDIEKYSIDEFFMDLEGISAKKNPIGFAKKLQSQILDELGLPCSIGLSEGKFIAKFTTDMVKPFGIGLTKVDEAKQKFKNIDIGKFPGVGRSVLKTLNKNGVFTIGQTWDAKFVFEKLGKNGIKLYENITGSGGNDLEILSRRKSFSRGRTFDALKDRQEVKRRVLILCRYLSFDIFKFGQNPTKFELKIRYYDRQTFSQSVTIKEKFSENLLDKTMMELFDRCDKLKQFSIMYISVGVGGFVDEGSIEKNLFSGDDKDKKIYLSIQKIREKYGIDSVLSAAEIKNN